jgi:hypothetical protein
MGHYIVHMCHVAIDGEAAMYGDNAWIYDELKKRCQTTAELAINSCLNTSYQS